MTSLSVFISHLMTNMILIKALNERYAAQEAEVQKAEREREKRDAIDKANSSAHSDGSVKSSSIRLRKTRAPKVI